MYPSHKYNFLGEMLPGLQVFNNQRYIDSRGAFSPLFTTSELDELMRGSFRQLNLAESKFGVLRGLHYQDQTKLVSPVSGKIFDVAVNVDTGQWFGIFMDNTISVLIPPQYAHGYLVLSDDAIVQYVVDAPYNSGKEETFAWNAYGINWPLTITPQLSDKDSHVAQKAAH